VSITRVVSHEPLTDAECRSLAPARAKRLAYSLSGRARYLYEMLTGEPAVDDGGATPLNPQGRMGIDRSGPPWGDAHLHPMWTYAATVSTVLAYVYPAANVTHQRVIEMSSGVDSFKRITARFWVRPHYAAPSMPYTRAYLRARATRIGGSGTATATIRVYGPEGDSGPSTSATVSTAGAASFSLGAWCPVSPGWNERIIEIEQTSSTGCYVGPISLNQVVRRSH
jgi:hypothetical protein